MASFNHPRVSSLTPLKALDSTNFIIDKVCQASSQRLSLNTYIKRFQKEEESLAFNLLPTGEVMKVMSSQILRKE